MPTSLLSSYRRPLQSSLVFVSIGAEAGASVALFSLGEGIVSCQEAFFYLPSVMVV
jgi:hypothetical protein